MAAVQHIRTVIWNPLAKWYKVGNIRKLLRHRHDHVYNLNGSRIN